MSSQKSDLPIRSNGNGHAAALHTAIDDLRAEAKARPGKIDLAEQKGFQTDPYASPAVYYGESHGSKKTSKTRTLSSVSLTHTQRLLPCSPRISRETMILIDMSSDTDTLPFADRRTQRPYGVLGP